MHTFILTFSADGVAGQEGNSCTGGCLDVASTLKHLCLKHLGCTVCSVSMGLEWLVRPAVSGWLARVARVVMM